jgi:hypothetical protein
VVGDLDHVSASSTGVKDPVGPDPRSFYAAASARTSARSSIG